MAEFRYYFAEYNLRIHFNYDREHLITPEGACNLLQARWAIPERRPERDYYERHCYERKEQRRTIAVHNLEIAVVYLHQKILETVEPAVRSLVEAGIDSKEIEWAFNDPPNAQFILTDVPVRKTDHWMEGRTYTTSTFIHPDAYFKETRPLNTDLLEQTLKEWFGEKEVKEKKQNPNELKSW